MERQTATKVQKTSTQNHSVQRQPAASSSVGNRFIELQRSIGNQAAQRLISSRYIQAKLQVSTPGDPYEQEADRVADTVMRLPDPHGSPSVTISNRPSISRVHRKCTECDEEVQRQSMNEEEETLQRSPLVQTLLIHRCTKCESNLQRQSLEEEQSTEEESVLQGKSGSHDPLQASCELETQLDSLRGGGQPLPQSVRAFFEPRFGQDFSGVRVHTGAQAALVARSINAQAFTVGKNVAFASGRYSPDTSMGQRLLAHELTHVVQQGGAARTSLTSTSGQVSLRRQADDRGCPDREPRENEISRSNNGFLSQDVTVGSGRLTISDFGIDWRHIKPTARREPLLTSWLNTFETDDSYRLRIVGYSDCFGGDDINIHLRQGRAVNVERMLGPRAQSRVTFRGMRALGDFLVPNDSVQNRARNRSVVIEFHQDFTFPPEPVTGTAHRCGPDVTQWLIDQMNTNKDHPTIRTMRNVQWPRYIPGFNIGWTAAALEDFVSLVRGGAVWDFKSRQGNRTTGVWRASPGRHCPTTDCDQTVTMCGMCFNYDVPGNLHFGWIGRAASLRSWFLHFGAGIVQPGRWTDDPKDAAAVEIGEAMWDSGADLCSQLRSRRTALNLDRTPNCSICTIP